MTGTDESGQAISHRAREAAKFIQDVGQLAQIATIILTMAVFFMSPAAVLRGEASDVKTYVMGFIGLAFWGFAIITLGEHYGA